MYRQIVFEHRFSLSFIASFEDAFQCSICQQTPARPPLITCSACSTLVGCETCTNEWYRESSLYKRCPKCCSERGLAKTFVLRGFNEVVTQIRQLHEDGNDNESKTLADTLPVVAPECKTYFGTVCFIKAKIIYFELCILFCFVGCYFQSFL